MANPIGSRTAPARRLRGGLPTLIGVGAVICGTSAIAAGGRDRSGLPRRHRPLWHGLTAYRAWRRALQSREVAQVVVDL